MVEGALYVAKNRTVEKTVKLNPINNPGAVRHATTRTMVGVPIHLQWLRLGWMGKNKAQAPTLAHTKYMFSCVNLTRRSRCNSSSRCCYRVPGDDDPTGSREIRCGGDGHPEMPSSPGSVGLARARPLTKTQAMAPSRHTRYKLASRGRQATRRRREEEGGLMPMA